MSLNSLRDLNHRYFELKEINLNIPVTGIGQSGNPDLPTWGNGASMARLLAFQGAKIFGCDMSLEAALRTKRRVSEFGADVTVTQANVTVNDDVKKAVDQCIAMHGRIDILIK